MSGGSDPRWDDPRDRDDKSRDLEVHWIELGRGPASDRQSEDDTRDRDHDVRDRASGHDSRKPGHDPRDVFLDGLELPRGLEREVVLDRGHRYEINGEESGRYTLHLARDGAGQARLLHARLKRLGQQPEVWCGGTNNRYRFGITFDDDFGASAYAC
jgi:hypothetical protein